MDRRAFVAAIGSLTAAGCSTVTDPSTETDPSPTTSSPTRSATDTRTSTDRPTDSPTATERDTPTPVFSPVVYYDTCERIAVQADQYDRVTLFFADSAEQFDAGYSGTNTFRGTGDTEGAVVHEVAVTRGQQTVIRGNPTLESCTTTPTPTDSPTPTPAQRSAARRGLDVFSYERVDSDPYEVFISIDNENDYDVQAFVTTEFFGGDGDRYDIQYDFQRIDAGDEFELVHRYDGPDDRTVTDHVVTVDADRAD